MQILYDAKTLSAVNNMVHKEASYDISHCKDLFKSLWFKRLLWATIQISRYVNQSFLITLFDARKITFEVCDT